MNKKETLLDTAWMKVFSECCVPTEIAQKGFYDITSDRLKKIANYEPRLLAKCDHQSDLAQPFKDNGYALLALSRKLYRIAPFQLFHHLESFSDNMTDLCYLPVPAEMQILNTYRHRSESLMIAACYAAGVFSDFLKTEGKILPSISGRLVSPEFAFSVNSKNQKQNLNIATSGVQIEIDAGFETATELALIEAKNSYCDDFNLRQLYYPFRFFHGSTKKKIAPVFMRISNDIISLWKYEYIVPFHMNSLQCVGKKRYILEEFRLTLDDIQKVVEHTHAIPFSKESFYGAPFPQADNFDRVISFCENIMEQAGKTEEDVIEWYGFVARQSGYYFNSARFLGLMKKEKGCFYLTEKGIEIMRLPYKKRQIKFIECIMRCLVFKKVFQAYLQTGGDLSLEQINLIMQSDPGITAEYSGDTPKRRASSIRGWIKWVFEQRTEA